MLPGEQQRQVVESTAEYVVALLRILELIAGGWGDSAWMLDWLGEGVWGVRQSIAWQGAAVCFVLNPE